eukprot:11191758-Lingulodinium_polyedra.AAC.1
MRSPTLIAACTGRVGRWGPSLHTRDKQGEPANASMCLRCTRMQQPWHRQELAPSLTKAWLDARTASSIRSLTL